MSWDRLAQRKGEGVARNVVERSHGRWSRNANSLVAAASASDPPISWPTRRVLFGPLPNPDVSGAVIRRLRVAIGLGLLADGERLPKESDLARQLGISNFSLREALGELRSQGLVITRPGKYGGSFVRYPPENAVMARDELVRLSFVELRDLGDWRHMLASHSAALAAERGSESNYKRLYTFAGQVAAAETHQQARRAHGRFHIELASAAQSMRMSRAEFAVHEEIDWLFSLALQTSAQREISAQGLFRITDAIRLHDSDLARIAAGDYSTRLVKELVQLRLEIIASLQSEQEEFSAARLQSTLETEIESFASSLLAPLDALSKDVAPLLGGNYEPDVLRTRTSKIILKRMDSFSAFVHGLGVMAEVGIVPGHPLWMVWWHATKTGPSEWTHHVMDPAREDYYDYESREFMAHPRQRLEPWASGPYVDYGGVDDYTITVSAPIVHDGRFLGVTAADILVVDMERRLAPWLAASDDVFLLLNSEDRVIVSNSVAHVVGNVVRSSTGYRSTPFKLFGWHLLTKAGATQERGQL